MPFEDRFILAEGTRVMPLLSRNATNSGQRKQIFSGEVGVIIRPARDIYSRLTVLYDCGSQISYMPHEVVPCEGECPFDLRAAIVLKTRIGSHAHGISHEESDDDFRGVFVAPSDLHWSLSHTPRRIEYLQNGLDEIYYEVGGFVRRLLTGDPMVIESLFSTLVIQSDAVGEYILANRQRFLTLPAMMGFPYFLRNQMKDLNRRNRAGKFVKPKALMHSYRLARSALRAVATGEFSLLAGDDADDFIAIREGNWTFEAVNQAVHRTLRQFDEALDDSPLPDVTAREAADDVLIFARGEFARRWLEKDGASQKPISNGQAKSPLLGVAVRGAKQSVKTTVKKSAKKAAKKAAKKTVKKVVKKTSQKKRQKKTSKKA